MLRTDIVVPHGSGFGDGVFEDLLGLGGEGDLTRRAHVGAHGDNFFHLALQRREGHVELLEDRHGQAIPLPGEAEEEVFCPHKVMAETDRLFSSQDDYLPCPFRKPLKHD